MSGFTSLALMTTSLSITLLGIGVELTNSRRYIDLSDASLCRLQYNSTTQMSIEIDYSLDGGNTWAIMVPSTTYVTGTGPWISSWVPIPKTAIGVGDVLIRAFGFGSFLNSIDFVEFQCR